MNLSDGQLRLIASMSRRVPVRGTARLLRRLHAPSSRVAAVETIVSIGDGLNIQASTRSDIEWQLFFYGGARFEPGIRKVLSTYITRGGFVIDVGANVGVHTVAMAKAAYPGRIAAFEPSPQVRERLAANVALNSLSNVDMYPYAVGAHDGLAELHVPPSDADLSPYASLRSNSRYLSESIPIQVPATSLDAFAHAHPIPKVSLIKIDVEGLEPEVLDGAAELLAKDRPVLVFEFDEEWWGQAGHTFAAVKKDLLQLGYSKFSEVTERGLRVIGDPVPRFMNVFAAADHVA